MSFYADNQKFVPDSYQSLHPARIANDDMKREPNDFNKGDTIKSVYPVFHEKFHTGPLKVPENQKELNLGCFGFNAVGHHLDNRSPDDFNKGH